jgi:hypothetical protein
VSCRGTGGGGGTSKIAVKTASAASVTWQPAAPVQAPDHPVKVVPAKGDADNVTGVPGAKVALQVPGQEMPRGVELTAPWPWIETESLRSNGSKRASTRRSRDTRKTHVPVPVQSPVQPVKTCDPAGTARSVTVAFWPYSAAQSFVQESCAVSVTVPYPETATDSLN